jgi:AraC-like DNA-binding protein
VGVFVSLREERSRSGGSRSVSLPDTDLDRIIADTLRNVQQAGIDLRARIAVETLVQSNGRECFTRIASALNLSKSRLHHLIKVEVGLPPAKLSKLLKVQATRQLLENTCLSIKQISHKVGVNDTSHFVRDFKRTIGVTPTQYRRLVSQDNKFGQYLAKIAS